jgi:hypothetical protein
MGRPGTDARKKRFTFCCAPLVINFFIGESVCAGLPGKIGPDGYDSLLGNASMLKAGFLAKPQV